VFLEIFPDDEGLESLWRMDDGISVGVSFHRLEIGLIIASLGAMLKTQIC